MPTTRSDDGYLRKVLGKDEKILLIVRQHGLFFLRHVFLWAALALVIVGVTFAAMISNPGAPGVAYVLLLAVGPLLVVWWQYLAWTSHKYVVTNRRVLQLSGVLSKEVLDSLLDQLNDVKTDQSLLGRIFDYGDVEILTASDVQTNQFHNIAQPLLFKRTLLDAKEGLNPPRAHGG